MDDITVVVAQVKTVVVPEDEVDIKKHSFLIRKRKQHHFTFFSFR
jgi:hypothetical protein